MKKAGLISLFLFLFLTQPVLARSGCCSHHQGVRADGCGCNDGTPLSSTCAPYYTCTANEAPAYVYPTSTPYPTRIPTLRPTSTPIPTFTPSPTLTETPTPTVTNPTPLISRTSIPKEQKHESFWERFLSWLFGWNK